MMAGTGFKEGYDFFQKSAGAIAGAFEGEDFVISRANYLADVEKEINALEQSINNFAGVQTANKMLKGDIAEFWHTGTFNVNAATNESVHRAIVDRSHDFGSVDISTNFGNDYGLKYYANGQESAKAQAISVFQRFKEYQAHGGKDDLAKFLSDRQYDSDAVINDPIYSGQIRVIPRDQMTEATKWLEEMIAKEGARRPEQVKRYQETLDMLRDRIADTDGNESIPLSKADAEKLAQLAKEGKFKAENFGIEAPELLNAELIVKESLKAGMSAAVISLVLKVGPEIYKSIDYLIKNGEIEEGQFKKIGFAAVSGTSEGFIRGSVVSAITACCKSGILGESLKDISPGIISAVTVIAMNTLKNAYQVAQGKKSRTELSNELVRDVFLTTSSMAVGAVAQSIIPVPVLGYMIGSMVGSVAESFIYNIGQQATITFCAETGITLFGLVNQDYKLPDDVIKDIGVATFDYESFEPETFDYESFEPETFAYDTIQPDSLGIKFLRRGVIGVSKIGYVE